MTKVVDGSARHVNPDPTPRLPHFLYRISISILTCMLHAAAAAVNVVAVAIVPRPTRDADQSAVSFRYRRPDQPGKVYLFKTAGAPSSSSSSSSGVEGERCPPAQFFLGEKGGEIMSADVDLKPLERRSSPNLFESEDFYQVGVVLTWWAGS